MSIAIFEPKYQPFANQGDFIAINRFVLSHIMPRVSGNAYKLLSVILLNTTGHGQPQAQLSYTDLKQQSGIRQPHTIKRALTELLNGKYILSRLVGGQERTIYSLNHSYEMDSPATEIQPTDKAEASAENAQHCKKCSGSGGAENAVETTAKNTPRLRHSPKPIHVHEHEHEQQKELFTSSLRSDVLSSESQISLLTADTPAPVKPVDKISQDNPAYVALREACEVDLRFASRETIINAVSVAKRFLSAGTKEGLSETAIAAQIRDCRCRWNVADWRGKKGQAPTPKQLADNFRELMTRTDIQPVDKARIESNGTNLANEYRATPTNRAERDAARHSEIKRLIRDGYIANGMDPRTCTTPGIFTAADIAAFDLAGRSAIGAGGGAYGVLHEAA